MRQWNLQELKKILDSAPVIKGWIITQESLSRRERYFLLDQGELAIDQDREARDFSIRLRVFVRLGNQQDRQGESSIKLHRDQPLEPQLKSLLEAAALTDQAVWELAPTPKGPLPQVQAHDPAIAEDIHGAMERLTARLASAVAGVKGSQFNSAELFVALHEREQHFSSGLVHRSLQTRIYSEAAFSATGSGISDEYLETRWSVLEKDLPLEELVHESAERARHMVKVGPPVSGVLPVLLDSEVLLTLFNGHLSQLSGANRYHDLPCLKVGDPLIPSARGDLITLHLDPALEGGADTVAVSGDGTPQVRRTLVRSNRVEELLMDQQHAQYLGLPVGVSRGSVVMEPGTRSKQELIASQPRVLEVLQLSGLFTDENSGTFGSEIRLARLHERDTGRVTYIKGGSLSGSIQENFADLGLSRETIRRCHFENDVPAGSGYSGPAWALLSDVSISG
jgi:predicted Zn-dependent protease